MWEARWPSRPGVRISVRHRRCRLPEIDGGKTCGPQGLQMPEAPGVHPAQCDHWPLCRPRQQCKAQGPKPRRSRMAGCREHRRHEKQLRAPCTRPCGFPHIMHRRRHQPLGMQRPAPGAGGQVNAIRLHPRRRIGDHQQKSPPAAERAKPDGQKFPIRRRKPIVTQHHPASARQGADSPGQVRPQPFVGHQPCLGPAPGLLPLQHPPAYRLFE